jgi:hypothetical protein
MVFQEAAFSKVCSRPPDRHEVEWILWVTEFEIFVLNHLLQGGQLSNFWNETVLNSLENGLQSRTGKVKVEHRVADQLPKLAAHNSKQCIGGFPLNRWWLLHLWSEVRIIHVERNPAVPGGS